MDATTLKMDDAELVVMAAAVGAAETASSIGTKVDTITTIGGMAIRAVVPSMSTSISLAIHIARVVLSGGIKTTAKAASTQYTKPISG